MGKTTIAWTDTTWNPVRGCSIVSAGCTNCYAMKMAHRFSGPGKPYDGLTKMSPGGPVWTGKVRCVSEKLGEPLYWRKPQRIFVNSMSDLFHEDVPDSFIDQVFAVMGATNHTFQILTKRPARMREYIANEDPEDLAWRINHTVLKRSHYGERATWPLPNAWLGVSAEDQRAFNERWPLLRDTPAAIRFLSLEPLLGAIDIRPALTAGKLHWVIIGGESGPKARPFDVAWARSVRDQCSAAGVSYFFKQTGSFVVDRNGSGFEGDGDDLWPAGTTDKLVWEPFGYVDSAQGAAVRIKLKDRAGADPAEWPEDLRVREFPA